MSTDQAAAARFCATRCPAAGGGASLSADIAVTHARVRDLGVALPAGWLAGEAAASVEM